MTQRTTNQDPRVIVQDFLDRQGDATIEGDVEATLGWCDIPCILESAEGHTVVASSAEMGHVRQAGVISRMARGHDQAA